MCYQLLRFKFINQFKNKNSFKKMPWNRTNKIILFIIVLYILQVLYIVKSAYVWNEISTCFQRILFVNSCYVLYLRFANAGNPGFGLDMLQITLVLWIVEDYNKSDESYDISCLESGESYFLYASDIFYQALLWTYTFSSIFLITLVIGSLAYLLIDIFYLRPIRLRDRGLTENEFNQISIINYADGVSENTLCSICLNEFNQNERVAQLPACKHLFHSECVRLWLNTHLECPYCRSNVKDQLNRIKSQGIDVEMNNYNNNIHNNDSQIHLEVNNSDIINNQINSQIHNNLHI